MICCPSPSRSSYTSHFGFRSSRGMSSMRNPQSWGSSRFEHLKMSRSIPNSCFTGLLFDPNQPMPYPFFHLTPQGLGVCAVCASRIMARESATYSSAATWWGSGGQGSIRRRPWMLDIGWPVTPLAPWFPSSKPHNISQYWCHILCQGQVEFYGGRILSAPTGAKAASASAIFFLKIGGDRMRSVEIGDQ